MQKQPKETENRLRMSALLLTLSILIPFSLFTSSQGCGITIYWGQNGNEGEGDLISACASGYYKYVSIAFLNTFGSGQTPVLNLTGHCGDHRTCTRLQNQVRFCQSQNIKVLLSLGGAIGSYNISSPEDAREVANYLTFTYLSNRGPGPFGLVNLNGIDFDIENPGSTLYWDDLARALKPSGLNYYLSAAPQCTLPDRNLDAAIKTGLFDSVNVKFYNNPSCDYSGGVFSLLNSWNTWSLYLPAGTKLSLGLPAAPEAASSGYIPPDVVVNQILPVIRTSSNYGGVMLWNRFYDKNNGFGSVIAPAVYYNCSTVNHEELSIKQVTFP